LTIPGGAILYAVGTTVTYDTSGGMKKHDPKQTAEDHKEDKFGPIVNTNGNYIFDVVWKNLYGVNLTYKLARSISLLLSLYKVNCVSNYFRMVIVYTIDFSM